jgi:hypothetical protein
MDSVGSKLASMIEHQSPACALQSSRSMGYSDDPCLSLSEGFAAATNFFARDWFTPGILVLSNDLLDSSL